MGKWGVESRWGSKFRRLESGNSGDDSGVWGREKSWVGGGVVHDVGVREIPDVRGPTAGGN